jgi:hypothetical protein
MSFFHVVVFPAETEWMSALLGTFAKNVQAGLCMQLHHIALLVDILSGVRQRKIAVVNTVIICDLSFPKVKRYAFLGGQFDEWFMH